MQTEKKDSARTAAIGCLSVLIIGIVGTVSRVFVLLQIWRWFLVPLGAPDMPYWQMFGLSIFFNVVRGYKREKKDWTGDKISDIPAEKWGDMISSSVVVPWMYLLTAWFVRWISVSP